MFEQIDFPFESLKFSGGSPNSGGGSGWIWWVLGLAVIIGIMVYRARQIAE